MSTVSPFSFLAFMLNPSGHPGVTINTVACERSQSRVHGGVREDDSVPERLRALEFQAEPVREDPAVAVGGRGRGPAPYDLGSDEHGVPVDEPFAEERGDDFPSAFDEDAPDTQVPGLLHGFAEAPGTVDLGTVPFGGAVGVRENDCSGTSVQDLRVRWGAPASVQDDADRVLLVRESLDGEVGVVGEDGARSDEDSVVSLPEPFDAGFVLLGRYADLLPLRPCDFAVRGHSAVDVDEGLQSEDAPGLTVKWYPSSFLSTPNLTSRNDSSVSIWERRCLLILETVNLLCPSAIAM